MISLLQSIVNSIATLFQLVINAFAGLLTIIVQFPKYFQILASYLTYLPAVFIPFFTATISLWILYFILGRDH